MHRTASGATPPDTDAGHATSKWSMAIDGIERLTAPPFDQGLKFGLELWPRAAPGCTTLGERIRGIMATNTQCEGPEIVVAPGLSTGVAIASALDPETTPICLSTPTGSALIGANDWLKTHPNVDGGRQFIVLVTDGADWDQSCPNPNPLAVVDAIRDGGVSTLVVGFSAEASVTGGVGAAFLDDLACAGGTARGYPGTCFVNDAGVYRARNAGDAGLFFVATDAVQLLTGLGSSPRRSAATASTEGGRRSSVSLRLGRRPSWRSSLGTLGTATPLMSPVASAAGAYSVPGREPR